MKSYTLSHLADQALLSSLSSIVARDRATTAALLAHLSEVEERRLYLPAAHPSMFSYCMNVLHFSEQATFKRIRAARMARRFPAIYGALAEGRVHLSGLIRLKPFLNRDTVDELLAAVAHKSSTEIEYLLAQRFPKGDVPTRVRALPRPSKAAPQHLPEGSTAGAAEQLSPGTVEASFTAPTAPTTAELLSLRTVEAPAPRPKVAPLAPQRFSLQLTMTQEMHDKLRHAQALMSHRLPSGDAAAVIERALDTLIETLEKAKFAATDRPRAAAKGSSANPRHIPAHVKRAVWERDGCQCTFVSESGQRCPARKFLEFDHIDEVARGGVATVDRMRLRCRAHNQYEAERTFGVAFMQQKREEAQRAAAG